MRVASLLTILDALLETAAVVRAHFLTARAYGNVEGMLQAIETSMAVDQDLISLLEETPYESLELSAKQKFPKPPGTPEEIRELMRKLKRIYTASISQLLKTVPYDVPELEERRADITDHTMQAVGDYFRMLKRIMKEQLHSWRQSDEREFSAMLKLRAPRKRR